MFWKKKTKLPITADDKEWVDSNLQWINENIFKIKSLETIRLSENFNDFNFDISEKDVKFILERISQITKIDSKFIELEFYSEESITLDGGVRTEHYDENGTAGKYTHTKESQKISIEIQQLKDIENLISTIIHELSHHDLIHNIKMEEAEDEEYFTDLYTIALGFGIFMSNTKFKFNQWQNGDGWGGWYYSSQGYLPLEIISYAIAKIEFMKGNKELLFGDDLSKDGKNLVVKSLNYLWEHEK